MKKNCKGTNNNSWKGGRKLNSRGYALIWMPRHPHAMRGGYIYEHRLVVEEHMGRFLHPEEEVHHIDGNKQNNQYENLKLFQNKAEHVSFERKQKKTIAQIMREVLIESGFNSVMYGDVTFLDECAIRSKHTTLMGARSPKRHTRIFKALDNSGLFIKSKIRIPLLDGRTNYPVCCFTLIQEWPEDEGEIR